MIEPIRDRLLDLATQVVLRRRILPVIGWR
jgi:hypothetical protein